MNESEFSALPLDQQMLYLLKLLTETKETLNEIKARLSALDGMDRGNLVQFPMQRDEN